MSNITTSLFQEMVQSASTRLNKQAEYVNSLNVFPVPDGDTGTNMGMTIENGAKEVADKSASTVGEVAGIFAKGLLMGAWEFGCYHVSAFPRLLSKCEREGRINGTRFSPCFSVWSGSSLQSCDEAG